MLSLRGLLEIVIEVILVFGGFFVLGTFLRAEAMGGHAGRTLVFFSVVALAGGVTGAIVFGHTPGAAMIRSSQVVER